MKNPNRPKLLLVALFLGATAFGQAALVPTEWAHRQAVTVTAPGLTRLTLPPAAFDAAQPGLADLRLVDAQGRELPYLAYRNGELARTRPAPPAPLRVKSFRSSETGDLTQLTVETGTTEKLESILLETPVPFFLKAAHVEISSDGVTWQSLGAASPVFRQFGAEQLRLTLNRQAAAYVRVTLDNYRNRPLGFTGAQLMPVAGREEPPAPVSTPARIVRRDEFVNETVLTVALDGRNLPLARIGLETSDPLFMRRVTVTLREADGATPHERTLGSGTLYRVALDGAEPRSELELTLPEETCPPTRELLVHIQNGDSPSLTVTGVTARIYATDLLFNAPAAGTSQLLTGNPRADRPRYDLAAFAGEMRLARATPATIGGLEDTPHYQPRAALSAAPLPDVPLAGAPLDTRDWKFHRVLRLAQPGVQELELDPAVLSGAQSYYADLRVMHGGNQIPYVLEYTPQFRALTLTPAPEPDPKRSGLSRWRLTLPQSNLPVPKLTLSSTTPLFSRHFRVFEKITTAEGSTLERELAAVNWDRKPEPGERETCELALAERLHADTLWIETDNGDNPAIVLGPVQAVYPVVRLIFKTSETVGFELAYGNATVGAPSYDLSLVASRLLTAPRVVAQLEPAAAKSRDGFEELKGGAVFWTVLSLVVVGLLTAVAKLLPKE